MTSVLDNIGGERHTTVMRLTNISMDESRTPSSALAPREMLLDCHLRIRHFLQLSRTLANAAAAPPPEIAEAARAIRDYFLIALPLHEADEEQTLLPRMRAAAPAGDPLHEACRLIVEQHRAVEDLLPELLSLCESIERKPARLPALAGRLRQVNQALQRFLEAHLLLEEGVIFPALGQLPAALLEEMAREMIERRRLAAASLENAATGAPKPARSKTPPATPGDGIHLVR